MPRKKAALYSGDLAKRIVIGSRGFRAESPDFEKAVTDELLRRHLLLLDHYKIDRTKPIKQIYFLLSLGLALDHVPGMQFVLPARRGRKQKWNDDEAAALVTAIDTARSKSGLKGAMRTAMKTEGWRWGQNIRSIESRYHEARRRLALSEALEQLGPLARLFRP